jgi:hypothetical protein
MSAVKKFRRGTKFPVIAYKEGEVVFAATAGGFAQPNNPTRGEVNFRTVAGGSADLNGDICGEVNFNGIAGGSADLTPPEWKLVLGNGGFTGPWSIHRSADGQFIALCFERIYGLPFHPAQYVSFDAGATWSLYNLSAGAANTLTSWGQVDGNDASIYACVRATSGTFQDGIWRFIFGGPINGTKLLAGHFTYLRCSEDRTVVVALPTAGTAKYSLNSGTAWADAALTSTNFQAVAVSGDGAAALVLKENRFFKGAPDGAFTETVLDFSPLILDSLLPYSLVTNDDGSKVYFAAKVKPVGGAWTYEIFGSTDGGDSFSLITTNADAKAGGAVLAGWNDTLVFFYRATTSSQYKSIFTVNGGDQWGRLSPDLDHVHSAFVSRNELRLLCLANFQPYILDL